MSELVSLSLGATLDLEQMIRDLGEPEPEHEFEHTFMAGLYIRQLRIKARSLVVGKMHRHASVLFLMKGMARIWSHGETFDVAAPHRILAPGMSKRVLFAFTDVEVMNVYPTNLRSLDEIEQELIVPADEVAKLDRSM